MTYFRDSNLFLFSPIKTEQGIPVFSEIDGYIENYQKIAKDHISSIKPGANNPFIPDKLWEELEKSTQQLISRHVPTSSRILDAGVGIGRCILPFNDLERHGIDISFDYLKLSQNNGIDVAFSLIEDMPYRNEIFDAVVACDVLEHVRDLNLCCKQLLRVLRPGGVLILRVPYREDLEVYLRKDLPYDFIHLRNFDLPGLRLLFEKVFKCEFIEFLYTGKYLQGGPRIKIKLLEEKNVLRNLVQNFPDDNHPLSLLKRIASVSEEELVQWAYMLQKDHIETFDRIKNDLLYAIEVNVVFKK